MPESIENIEKTDLYDAYETGSINTPAMDGSLQQFLADNLGSYVVVEFLMGTGSLVQKAGILYATGSSILTLYEDISQTFVTCDIFSVKFVTFYLPGHRPWEMTNPLFAQSGVGGPSYFQGHPVPGANQLPSGAAPRPAPMVPGGPNLSGQTTRPPLKGPEE